MKEMSYLQIPWIVKENYEQHFVNKFNSFNVLDQFLERYNLPKLTQGKTDNLNRPTSIKETESTVSNFLK